MDKLIGTGRVMYATGIIALGIICFISKDFIVGRPPAWPANVGLNPVLGYITGGLLILAAIAILFRKKAAAAALWIAALILLLSVLRHLPQFMNDWPNAYKSMALFGGSLIVAASFFKERWSFIQVKRSNKKLVKNLVLAGCVLLAAFFIAAGYAHFKFATFVKDLIPAYLPFHIFLTYFTACCLLAGGAGLLIPPTRGLAALLAGIMISGWFILLHIPRFLSNVNDAGDRMGLFESFTFAGILFVLAGMLANRPNL